MRLLYILLAVGLASAWSSPALSSSEKLDRYDFQIYAAVQKYWPRGVDADWYKAQLYQESRLDPKAISPAGAKGLAQIMPGTWEDLKDRLKLGTATPFEADKAIKAGAYYMADMYAEWSSPRPEQDRWDLARASYNAGLGSLLQAQKKCGMETRYCRIMACLPQVTGRHSEETILYNQYIHHWYRQFNDQESEVQPICSQQSNCF